jgi:hypothetical protein
MTGQWLLHPLAFGALPTFLPHWSAEELVAAYAIVGGVPAYLEWFQPELALVGNVRDVMLAPGSIFLSEPTLILSDEIRDPRVHRTIVQAIGLGAHTHSEISAASFVSKTHLTSYLHRLQELRLVERRLPVTIPQADQQRVRQGRYHLSDPFLLLLPIYCTSSRRSELSTRPRVANYSTRFTRFCRSDGLGRTGSDLDSLGC